MDINIFAPCGLICGLCKDASDKCKGCRYGGGDQDCYQLNCCRRKGLSGCWECEGFPCDKGYLGDEKWKGVITAFLRCIKEDGPETTYDMVKSKLGDNIDYENYLNRTVEDIVDMLRNNIKTKD